MLRFSYTTDCMYALKGDIYFTVFLVLDNRKFFLTNLHFIAFFQSKLKQQVYCGNYKLRTLYTYMKSSREKSFAVL